MNMSIQNYLTLQAAGRGAGLRSMLDRWLGRSGLAPRVQVQTVGDHAARVRVFPFKTAKLDWWACFGLTSGCLENPKPSPTASPARLLFPLADTATFTM